MSWVWPRLPHSATQALLRQVQGADLQELRRTAGWSHPMAAPVAVGGAPVPESVVQELQGRLQAIADGLGFPAPLSRAAVGRFDGPATRALHEVMRIVPADGACPEVWSFITLVVAPDLAIWRFPSEAENRLVGRPRNVFRRLWARADVIGVDLIDAPDGLGEDELVNIFERPTLSANPRVARALAEAIVQRGRSTGLARSEVMRDAAKRVLRQQAVISLDVLDDEQLGAVMDRCLLESLDAMAPPSPAPPPAPPSVPAGWLPDPSGRYTQRYWDGERWTHHAADAQGAMSTDPFDG